MGFLGKNINFALIVLILMIVLVATGTTVLYQRGLKERTSQFETTNSNLSQCLTALDNYKSVVSQKEAQLNDTSQDIRKYDTLYSQKVAELGQRDTDLQSTRQQLNAMTLQKEQFKSLYSVSLLNISSLQSDVEDLEDTIDARDATIRSLRSQLSACLNG